MTHSNRPMALLTVLVLATSVAGCAKRPVLYPNAHYNSVGKAASEEDISACVDLAKNADLRGSGEAVRAGKRTAGGAAVGAATGAVGGAIRGRAGQGAAVGAATGATAGLFSWLFSKSEPDPTYARFINQCLTDKGYQPIGWK